METFRSTEMKPYHTRSDGTVGVGLAFPRPQYDMSNFSFVIFLVFFIIISSGVRYKNGNVLLWAYNYLDIHYERRTLVFFNF